MSRFENKHTFTYKGKEIQIGNDLDMRENAIRGHNEALSPIRMPNIYIDYQPVRMSTFWLPTLPDALKSEDYTQIENLIKQYIDSHYR